MNDDGYNMKLSYHLLKQVLLAADSCAVTCAVTCDLWLEGCPETFKIKSAALAECGGGGSISVDRNINLNDHELCSVLSGQQFSGLGESELVESICQYERREGGDCECNGQKKKEDFDEQIYLYEYCIDTNPYAENDIPDPWANKNEEEVSLGGATNPFSVAPPPSPKGGTESPTFAATDDPKTDVDNAARSLVGPRTLLSLLLSLTVMMF